MKIIARAGLFSGLLAGLLSLTTGSARADERINFTMPQLYAEGIGYNPVSKEFLVSSLHYGVIGAVSMDGKYRQWSRSGGEQFMSSFGLKVDAPRGRVLVCVADLGVGERSSEATKHKFSGVAAYDMMTGQLRDFTNLARLLPNDEHFANDLTVDADGNIYVTDSFAPVIYKIDTNNVASVAFNDPRFGGEGIKLNGIVAHPDGYLLAVRMDSGDLYKFNLKTKEITQVALPMPMLGGDGLLLDADNNLMLVQNDKGVVRRLHSADGWKSASLIGSTQNPLSYPTTLTTVNGKTYVLEAKLPELFEAAAPKSDSFDIVAVQFVDEVAEVKKAEAEKAANEKKTKPKAKHAKHAKAVKAAKTAKAAKTHTFKETVVKQEPAAAAPNADAVKVAPPKLDAVKTETPKVEAPQVDAPKVEEAPKADLMPPQPSSPEVPPMPAPPPEPGSQPTPNLDAPKLDDAAPQLPPSLETAPKAEDLIKIAPPTPPMPPLPPVEPKQ